MKLKQSLVLCWLAIGTPLASFSVTAAPTLAAWLNNFTDMVNL